MSNKVRGVSPEAGRESMVGKICERGRSWVGSVPWYVSFGQGSSLLWTHML